MEIQELKIYTQSLLRQIDFYSKKIGLDVIDMSENQAVFQVGKSKLRMIKSERFHPYHFAINIPCNKEIEALEWLRKRVEILTDGIREIQDFKSWNAKAVYFYDPDHNIVEFIARKNLKNERQTDFDAASLLEISEIGMPVSDIETAFNTLYTIANVEKYDGGFESFCAIGDEHGLFICINKQIKSWFPIGDKANSADFEIKFREQGGRHEIAFVNGEIRELG
ncbi:VOC family protein [Muricauda sp. CAU 1633]|uniref:VOC family protein n=1 Tax=Allomuricauda sp. CAU 1633 TaxID=2816036 RepID=UPI001A8DCB37|nr:VOC family protein [Muricauda sp. CAU 1633]MBO0322237.1 VOC family protein [Muricauda sp. CAU 1633]